MDRIIHQIKIDFKIIQERVNKFETLLDFFNVRAYSSATEKKARLIFSIAMFYNLADPVNFSRTVAECLADDGVQSWSPRGPNS